MDARPPAALEKSIPTKTDAAAGKEEEEEEDFLLRRSIFNFVTRRGSKLRYCLTFVPSQGFRGQPYRTSAKNWGPETSNNFMQDLQIEGVKKYPITVCRICR